MFPYAVVGSAPHGGAVGAPRDVVHDFRATSVDSGLVGFNTLCSPGVQKLCAINQSVLIPHLADWFLQ